MKNLCITVSGGETSMYQAILLNEKLDKSINTCFVFANTGQEQEETLDFVSRCQNHFNLPIVWVEAVVHHGKNKGSTHKIVDYETACRDGFLFDEVCREYGLPNKNFIHCTRELKNNPIKSYCKILGWKKWFTTLGIRSDELDRVNPDYKKKRIYYPLAFDFPTTKPMINRFWRDQEFRLNLKGYEGNCKWCYKKNDYKHARLLSENPDIYLIPANLERKHKNVKAKTQSEPRRIFRGDRNTEEYIEYLKTLDHSKVKDDSVIYDVQLNMFSCAEECNPFG